MSDVYEWKDPAVLWRAPSIYDGPRRPDWLPANVWTALCRAKDRVGVKVIREMLNAKFGVDRIRDMYHEEFPNLTRELNAL
jgi:hypothetical protein